MKLKTLKDIEAISDGSSFERVEKAVCNRIKAEAIKWVKEITTEKDKYIRAWIIHFFNITEEDLK